MTPLGSFTHSHPEKLEHSMGSRGLNWCLIVLLFAGCSSSPKNVRRDESGAESRSVFFGGEESNEANDRRPAEMTGAMLQAANAVLEYRRTTQRGDLTKSERDIGNFTIRITRMDVPEKIAPPPEPWPPNIEVSERRNIYIIVLHAKFLPDEPMAFDGERKLGRSAEYAVSKDTFTVIAAR